jgi:hypothetical protein
MAPERLAVVCHQGQIALAVQHQEERFHQDRRHLVIHHPGDFRQVQAQRRLILTQSGIPLEIAKAVAQVLMVQVLVLMARPATHSVRGEIAHYLRQAKSYHPFGTLLV